MSNSAINWCHRQQGIPSNSRFVLLILSDMADKSNEAWPSIEFIVGRTGLSKRSVQSAIAQLKSKRMISITHRHYAHGGQKSSLYTVNVVNEQTALDGVQDVHGEDASHAPHGMSKVHGRDARAAPKSPSEPSNKTPGKLEPSALCPSGDGPVPNSSAPSPDLSKAVHAWNAMAALCGLRQVIKLTKKREDGLRRSLRECGGLDGWDDAMNLVSESSFLRGDGSRNGWTAGFDFITRRDVFLRLMEGSYTSTNQFFGQFPHAEPEPGDELHREAAYG